MNDDVRRYWHLAQPILDGALELEPDRREAFLESACSGDEALRRAVEALLCADSTTDSPLDRPFALIEDLDRREAPALPDRIGPFRIVREIGRGGMGTVLLGERDDGQFEQRVAIKLLQAGTGRIGAAARFDRERRILARLEHPNIARLIDGGVTDDGVPYFAMEYVEGRPLIEACEVGRFDVDRRLRLFRQVCVAVEHAHARLVVHRDLKPGNVLVTEGGHVKLLDFGIAEPLGDEIDGDVAAGWPSLMTPAYAAPEQFLGEEITVATDVYALGLLLYELLTGHRAQGERSTSQEDLRREILETEPTRPSLAVRPTGGTGRSALERRLAGDLDAMVLRALRKEPEQRYASVEALRRDLDNYLDQRPVSARGGHWRYRLGKAIRRRRVEVAAGVVATLSLLGGLVATASQSRTATEQRDLARAAEDRALAINDFVLNELLQAPSPELALGRDRTVGEVLANASSSVRHAFPRRPELEAEVRLTLARTYSSLGRYDEAVDHATAARILFERALGSEAPGTLRARTLLAWLRIEQGRYSDARTELVPALAGLRSTLGADHPDTLDASGLAGRLEEMEGNPAAAEHELRHVLRRVDASADADWRLATRIRGYLVDALVAQNRAADAEPLCREILELTRRHVGPDHPETAEALQRLARVLQKELRYREGVDPLRQVVEIRTRLYGDDHPATGEAWLDLGVMLHRLNQYDASEDATRHALDIFRRTLGDDHPQTVRALRNLGVGLRLSGRWEEAEPIYREVLATSRGTLGDDHPRTIDARRNLNILVVAAGRTSEAREIGRQVVESYERLSASPDGDPSTLNDYALFLLEVDPPDLRDPFRALALAERIVDRTGRRQYLLLRTLALAQRATGARAEAVATMTEALGFPEAIRSWTSEQLLVDWLEADGRGDRIEPFLLERLERMRELRGADEPLIGKTLRLLALHRAAAGRAADAERSYREALQHLRRTLPAGNWEIGRAASELGGFLLDGGRPDEAGALLSEGFEILSRDAQLPAATLDAARERLDRWRRIETPSR